MARLFNDASSEFLEHAAAVVSNEPFSMACWFRSDTIALNQTLMAVYGSGSGGFWRIAAAGAVAGDPMRAQKGISGTNGIADTTTGYGANTWHHACGVFISDTSRAAYIDGGSKATNAISVTDPTLQDRTGIGREISTSGGSQHMSGDIAEAAIWDAALTDDDVLILSKGFSPLFVRPANLVAYWPLLAYSSPELDRVGGFGMTVTGAVKSDHPRIIYPSRARLILPAAAAAGGKGFLMEQGLFVGGGFAA